MAPSLIPLLAKISVSAFPLRSAACSTSRSSSIVGTLSSAYLLALGNTLCIFFQFSCTSLISSKSLAAFTQLFIVPAEISPRSALARSEDRNAIILFSVSTGLFFANSTNASGDSASS